jgi:hypothetical protein
VRAQIARADGAVERLTLGTGSPASSWQQRPRRAQSLIVEFDRVIVIEPSVIAADGPGRRTGLRRLSVVLARAVCALTVFPSDELPAELAGRQADRLTACLP